MAARIFIASALIFTCSQLALADVARHESLELGSSGTPETYSVIYADDAGNLRVETYGADATASSGSAAGGQADTAFSRGALQGLMVFQAAEGRMLVFDGDQCQVLSADMSEMPGMPPGGMEDYREQMAAAQAEMQAALEEMRRQDPAMARMLEERMAGSGAMASMMQQPREMIVEETGDDRTIGDYDTSGFIVYEEGTDRFRTSVWAADIDDVEGGRIVGGAMQGMFELYRDVMDSMGIGSMAGAGLAGAVLEKMGDYYPVMTESQDRQTRLTGAELGGTADFYPECE